MRSILLALSILLAAAPAYAGDLASRDILIPVVARTPGALGTQWFTDLVITNLSRDTSGPTRLSIGFYSNSGQLLLVEEIDIRQSLVLPDVVKNSFELEQAAGYVRVTAIGAAARISAQARVFNRGSSGGEYGQAVPGVPVDALSREHFIAGLSGLDGNRSNVGITNPWSVTLPMSVDLIESDGNSRGIFYTEIQPRSVRQFNNIFAEFGVAPSDGAMVRLKSALPFYGYGTVVRQDTGDSTFIQGTGLTTGNEMLAPAACANPAPVSLAEPGQRSAGNWIVFYRAGTNATAVTNSLAARLGFTPQTIFEFAFKGFAAALTPEQLAQVRCESPVTVIEENIQSSLP